MKKICFRAARVGLALLLSVSTVMTSGMTSLATEESVAVENLVEEESPFLDEEVIVEEDDSLVEDFITEIEDESQDEASETLDEFEESSSSASSSGEGNDVNAGATGEDDEVNVEDSDASLTASANQIGDNITYSFNTSNGQLRITGTGSTYDFSSSDGPFKNLSNIKSVVFDKGITRIGENLFAGTGRNSGNKSTITSITLPSTLTELGNNALSGLSASDAKLVVPGTVTTMGEKSLGCLVNTITISEGITRITKNVFNGLNCSGITLPQSLEYIDEYGFADADLYYDLTIPKNVKSVGDYAFKNLRRTRTITFTGDLPTFGNDCFVENYLLGYYPGSNKTWTDSAVKALTEKFAEVTWNPTGTKPTSGQCGDNIKWTMTTRSNGGYMITLTGSGPMYDYSPGNQAPWSWNRQHVHEVKMDDRITTVGEYAFYDLATSYNATSHLSTSLTKVGNYAFYSTSLPRTNLPSSITYFGDYCFYGGVFFDGVGSSINPDVTYIGVSAFQSCESLEATLPTFTKLKRVENNAFRGCRKLKGTLQLPDTMTYIGDSAFSSCVSLSGELKLPKNLEYLGDGAFSNIPNLTGEITIPSKITTLKAHVFTQTGITSVVVGDNVTKMSHAFYYATGLKKLVIGKGITEITGNLCSNCPALEEVTIKGDVTIFKSDAFKNCPSLKTINIPASVETILSSCFEGCSSLTKLTFGNNLSGVYSNAFKNCSSLKEVTFGDHELRLWSNAFSGTAIEKYTFNGEKPVVLEGAFTGAKKNPTVYYPNKYASWAGITAKDMRMEELEPTFVGFGDYTTYTVSYYVEDTLYHTEKVRAGYKATKPKDPTLEHKVFQGWKLKGYYGVYDFSRPVTSDLKLEASFDYEKVQVTFKLLNGEPDVIKSCNYGYSLYNYLPTNPKKEGYGFFGWSLYEPKNGVPGEKLDTRNYEVTKSVTVYARFAPPTCKVTLVTNCDKVIDPLDVTYESTISSVSNKFYYSLTKPGYSRGSWYYDKDFKNEAKNTDLITKDITLYLKWTLITYTVTFKGNGADNFPAEQKVVVPSGQCVAKPNVIPHKDGCVFKFWGQGYAEFDFSKPITANQTIFAFFTKEEDLIDWGDISKSIREKMGFTKESDIPEGVWAYNVNSLTYSASPVKHYYYDVFYHKKHLTEKEDYSISYINNTNAGTAKMRITLKGSLSGTVDVPFTIKPYDLSKSISSGAEYLYSYNGKVQTFNENLKALKPLKAGKDYSIEYVGLGEKEGAFKEPGSYQVIIHGTGNYTGSASFKMTITPRKDLATAKIKGIVNKPYTGQYVTQDNLSVIVDKKVLTEGKDYTLEYDYNFFAGKAYVNIIAVEGSDYYGSCRRTFKILGKDIRKAKVKLFTTYKVYNKDYQGLTPGKDFEVIIPATKGTPAKTLRGVRSQDVNDLDDNEVLNYDYCYWTSNGFHKGTAILNIEGINNYCNIKPVKFQIKAKPLTDEDITTDFESSYTYVKGGVKPDFYVYDQVLRSYLYEDSVSISYIGFNKAGTATVKLTGKGDYTGTIKKTYIIEKSDIAKLSISVSDAQEVKSGKYKPTVSIRDTNGKSLVKGTDYTYKVEGTTVTITGKGNYTGEKKVTFGLYKQGIDKATITTKSRTFTGYAITDMEKDMVVTLAGKKLVYGKDYTIAGYYDNVKAGTAKVIIKGIGSYGGQKTGTFKIVKKRIK